MDWFAEFMEWWTTARVAAAAAVVGACSAIAGATSGVRTFTQTRNDSRARSRPMVTAELRDYPFADATQVLVIRNYGPSIARNVRVTFDPPVPEPDKPAESGAPFLKARYAKPLAVLTPGMELDNVYFSGRRQGSTWVNREPMPEQVTVRIEYEDDQGNEWSDDFPLDTDIIRNRTYITSSRDPDEQRKALLEAIQGIEKALTR